MSEWDRAVDEAVEWALLKLAEGLRDQAALAAEQGRDELAALLRDAAERVEPE